MIEHTKTGAGWSAECGDCPFVIEPDYEPKERHRTALLTLPWPKIAMVR